MSDLAKSRGPPILGECRYRAVQIQGLYGTQFQIHSIDVSKLANERASPVPQDLQDDQPAGLRLRGVPSPVLPGAPGVGHALASLQTMPEIEWEARPRSGKDQTPLQKSLETDLNFRGLIASNLPSQTVALHHHPIPSPVPSVVAEKLGGRRCLAASTLPGNPTNL